MVQSLFRISNHLVKFWWAKILDENTSKSTLVLWDFSPRQHYSGLGENTSSIGRKYSREHTCFWDFLVWVTLPLPGRTTSRLGERLPAWVKTVQRAHLLLKTILAWARCYHLSELCREQQPIRQFIHFLLPQSYYTCLIWTNWAKINMHINSFHRTTSYMQTNQITTRV